MSDQINIASSFQNRAEKAVALKVTVKYSIDSITVEGTETDKKPPIKMRGSSLDSYKWEWWFTYNYLGDNGEKPWIKNPQKDDAGNSNLHMEFYWWYGTVGRHLVQCRAKSGSGKDWSAYGKYPQEVSELKTILSRNIDLSRRHALPDPLVEIKFVKKYAELLYATGQKQGMSQDERNHVSEMYNYVRKLDALLNKCDRNNIVPFRATYLAEESMEVVDLRVFLTYANGNKKKLMVVDWTNLDEERLNDTYEVDIPAPEYYGEGAGSHADEDTTRRIAEDPDKLWAKGIKLAIDKWAGKNRYWPGGVQYELYAIRENRYHFKLEDNFKTGVKSAGETLAGWLKKIGYYAFIFSLVLTGVGSSAAGAIMVLSMVASATGAVLSIQQRHSRGENDALADAMDVLDIAANCLGVGGAAGEKLLWKAGRTVSIESAGAKAVQYMFVGQKYANGISGMLLGASFVKRYNDIIDNPRLSSTQRTDELIALLGDAAKAGALHVLNQKVATDAEKANWEKLLEKDAVPTHIDNDPHVGGGDGTKGGKVPDADGVPLNPVKDGDSGPHVVPSDGVPTVEGPGGDKTQPGDTIKQPNSTDDVNTAKVTKNKGGSGSGSSDPMKMTDKPGFKGKVSDGQKKVTVADKQQRHPTGGVPTGDPPPPPKPPAASTSKKLGLGLKSRSLDLDYKKWSTGKGFQIYSDLGGRGTFRDQIATSMKTAEEIHVNLDGVDVRFANKPNSNPKDIINEYGEPTSGYINYELYLLSTNKDFAKKVKWWNYERKPGAPEVEQPDGWWPPGLHDPR